MDERAKIDDVGSLLGTELDHSEGKSSWLENSKSEPCNDFGIIELSVCLGSSLKEMKVLGPPSGGPFFCVHNKQW